MIRRYNQPISHERSWSWKLDSVTTNYYKAGCSGIIISKETRNGKRQYRHFPNVIRFMREYMTLGTRHFHEVIVDKHQRMRFDIDASMSLIIKDYSAHLRARGTNVHPYTSVQAMCGAIGCFVVKSVYDAMNIALKSEFSNAVRDSHGMLTGKYVDINKRCVMTFTSHSQTANKFSMHIVFSKYSFDGAKACNQLFKSCVKLFPSWLNMYMDNGVYKKNQGFRLLASSKMNSNRVKTYSPIQEYYQYINDEQLFLDSLLSVVDNDRFTYVQLPEVMFIAVDVSEEDIERCRELLDEYEITSYQVSNVINGYILLTRKGRSYCSVCERDHTSENAFCVKYLDGFTFHCRRDPSNRVLLGVTETPGDTGSQVDLARLIAYACEGRGVMYGLDNVPVVPMIGEVPLTSMPVASLSSIVIPYIATQKIVYTPRTVSPTRQLPLKTSPKRPATTPPPPGADVYAAPVFMNM